MLAHINSENKVLRLVETEPAHIPESSASTYVEITPEDVETITAGLQSRPPVRYTLNAETGALTPITPHTRVPQSIPSWKGKAVLGILGLRDNAVTQLEGVPGDPGIVIRARWEATTEWVRTDPDIILIATALGLTSTQLDNLFIQAAAL